MAELVLKRVTIGWVCLHGPGYNTTYHNVRAIHDDGGRIGLEFATYTLILFTHWISTMQVEDQ